MDKNAFKLDLGRRLSEAREKKDVLAEDLAHGAGISAQALSNIEGGKVDCKSSTLYGICASLGVSSDYLLGIERRDVPDDIPILLAKLNDEETSIVEQLIRSLTATYHK